MFARLAPLAILLLIGGCATPPPVEPVVVRDAVRPVSRPARPGLSAEAQRALARRGIKPHDAELVSVNSQCSHVDEIGTATRLNLLVESGAVQDFRADVNIKGRGRCAFTLADFHQESSDPHVLLRHAKDKNCTVRMWREQGEKITVAFNSCQKSCEGKAFDYLWPILVESESGQCF